MCDHGEDKNHQYVPAFECRGFDIHICECGALVNYWEDLKNVNPSTPMTPDDCQKMMNSILKPIMCHIDNALGTLNDLRQNQD